LSLRGPRNDRRRPARSGAARSAAENWPKDAAGATSTATAPTSDNGTLELDEIVGMAMAQNGASQRVLEKCGLRHVGEEC
jgi:RimJ/RimL family protein N-acetyltransferase